jgi:CHASE1-domain containing sensor protein
MYSETVRRAALNKATEENTAIISGRVKLVQETDQDVQAGFLMYMPIYRCIASMTTSRATREY